MSLTNPSFWKNVSNFTDDRVTSKVIERKKECTDINIDRNCKMSKKDKAKGMLAASEETLCPQYRNLIIIS